MNVQPKRTTAKASIADLLMWSALAIGLLWLLASCTTVRDQSLKTETGNAETDVHSLSSEWEGRDIEEPADPNMRCPAGMVFIRGGTPRKNIYVSDYCLDVTEVTVEEYQICVEMQHCTPPQRVGWPATYPLQGVRPLVRRGRYPVNGVTWLEASQFCASRRNRLPSRDEWIWAARGRDEYRRYPWG